MKPAAILSELEREPIIFWGCTKTEIFRALRKGLLIGAVTATVVTVAGAILLRPSTLVALWMLSMMGTAYVYVRRRLYRIASLRAGRPLFYELHAMIYQSSRFVQPATRYQRERNVRPELAARLKQRRKTRSRGADDDTTAAQGASATVPETSAAPPVLNQPQPDYIKD